MVEEVVPLTFTLQRYRVNSLVKLSKKKKRLGK